MPPNMVTTSNPTNLKSNDDDFDSFDDAGVAIESKSVLSGRGEDPMRSDGECKA